MPKFYKSLAKVRGFFIPVFSQRLSDRGQNDSAAHATNGGESMSNSVSTTGHLDDLDFGDGVSEADINAIIDSGDADAIEALMRGEIPEIKEKIEPKPALEEKQGEEDGAASGAETSSEPEKNDADGDDVKAPILSKDGKRTIPYQVLETARDRAKAAAEENDVLKQKIADYEGQNQKVSKFLEKRGIDPAAITDAQAEALSSEDLAHIEELDPLLGKAVRVLSENLARQQASPTPVNAGNPVEEAIAANSHLVAWRKGDQDRWDFALSVDDKLKYDERFSQLSLTQRFAEAARRTRIAFGDEEAAPQKNSESTAEVAARKVAEATKSAVPRSLTNIGVTPSSERPLAERLSEMQPHEIEEAMQKMTPDQIQEVLGAIQ